MVFAVTKRPEYPPVAPGAKWTMKKVLQLPFLTINFLIKILKFEQSLKKPCPGSTCFGSGTLILCERLLDSGEYEKRLFCSALDELHCWTPVLLCQKACACTAAHCMKEILPGHLMLKHPTTLHYECFEASNASILCLLCEEELLHDQQKVAMKICGTFGYKHFPTCTFPAPIVTEGVFSAEGSQSVASSEEEAASNSPTKKRRH